MSRLIPNTTPAERAVGCSFGETMESAAKVIANGGEIFGTPTIDFGATFNGTTDYIKYPGEQNKFFSDFSICLCIKTSTLGTQVMTGSKGGSSIANGFAIYTTSSGNIVAVYSNGSSSSSSTAISSTGYNDGKYHFVTMSVMRGVSITLYFDDLSNTSLTAPLGTLYHPLGIGVGAYMDGSFIFEGEIDSVKFFERALEEKEHLGFYDNSTYNYRNDALVHLPMRACDHDPTNNRTLDVSGNGNNGALVGPPVKQAKRGYLFDGVNDAFTGLPALSGDYTVTLLTDNTVTNYNTDTVYESIKTVGGFTGVLQELLVTPYILTPLQEADVHIRMMRQINDV